MDSTAKVTAMGNQWVRVAAACEVIVMTQIKVDVKKHTPSSWGQVAVHHLDDAELQLESFCLA
jgi:hypothetical protein